MIDKRLLNDTVTIELINSVGEWGNCSYKEPIILKNVKFDRSVLEKTDKVKQKNSTLNKEGYIYIYPKYCSVTIDGSWIGAKVTDNFGSYTVKGFKVNKLRNKIFSFELEVI